MVLAQEIRRGSDQTLFPRRTSTTTVFITIIMNHSRFSSATALVAVSSTLRDGHLQLLVLYGSYDIPVLVVAEDSGAHPLELIEGLGGGMPVGVIRAALDDGHLWRKAAEEEWGR